ncbi:hypothetical protein PDJAM_G00171780, partial [Pangasius djambal]|nr:hypothetical protein [Pangasius djambal]
TSTGVKSEPPSSTPSRSTTAITPKTSTGVTTGTPSSPSSRSTTVEPTTSPVVIRYISFTTNETFVPELSNQSSSAFNDRAILVTTKLEPILKNNSRNFMKLTVIRFRSGSIITDMSLRYTYQGDLPSDQQIIDTIKNADTGFNMTDVFVTQTATTTTPTIPTTIAAISSATTKPLDTTATTKT